MVGTSLRILIRTELYQLLLRRISGYSRQSNRRLEEITQRASQFVLFGKYNKNSASNGE